jgi:hypothetical protein
MSKNKTKAVSTGRRNISLTQFVEENEKLITAIGVMGVLAALFANVKNGEYVCFLSFALLLVLYAELYKSLFKIDAHGIMFLFQWIAWSFPVAVGIFMAQTYWSYFKSFFVTAFLMVACVSVVPYVVRRPHKKLLFITWCCVFVAVMLVYGLIVLPHLPSTFPLNFGNQTAT